ncbi:TetR/AcrR family transcriptional regulator [Ammoniphilus sp. CFH 90114]|uniref:TetR/AcrR family transcriptional regulator n=1 Tax=Ammoniphilus sp. CFH 90114 TaxID=2493665 RepID=UPI0013E912AB|nr:TetR family transcriptional regulator [Ammoniphilus sp. CFH 90114]
MPKVSDQHKEQRAKLILLAAENVFKRKGYELTTVQDILDEAKISKGGFYLYFNGKDDVFAELEKQFELYLFSSKKEHLNPIEQLEALIQGVIHVINDLEKTIYPILFEYYLESYRNAERKESLERRYERSLAEIVSILERGMEQGLFKPRISTTSIARMLMTYLDGLVCDSMQLGKEKIHFEEQVLVIKQIMNDLLGKADQRC